MAAVELSIVEPEHNLTLRGTDTVDFSGTAQVPAGLNDVALYYRWYSSLYTDGIVDGVVDHYSINQNVQTRANQVFSWQAGIGTHAITFAVSDQAGESKADFEAIEHGGVTGGSEGDTACLIHVFTAGLLAPTEVSLPRVDIVLVAEAPAAWAVPEDPEAATIVYLPNEDYHAINRVQYRWLFEPQGTPAGRPTQEYIPTPEQMMFIPDWSVDPDIAAVSYSPNLSVEVTGQYRITLFVEDKLGESSVVDSAEHVINIT